MSIVSGKLGPYGKISVPINYIRVYHKKRYPPSLLQKQSECQRSFAVIDKSCNIFNGEKMKKNFDGQKTVKLGTEKMPAIVRVQTEERLKEVASMFEEKGWKYTIGLEPDEPEDIADLEILLNPQKPKIAERKIGRNEPCSCGSGKKYKKCCGK